jgi:hypothetical protein
MSSLSQFNRAERVSDKINEARATGDFVRMQPADAEMIPFILKNRGYILKYYTKSSTIQMWYVSDKISHDTAHFAFHQNIPGIQFVEPIPMGRRVTNVGASGSSNGRGLKSTPRTKYNANGKFGFPKTQTEVYGSTQHSGYHWPTKPTYGSTTRDGSGTYEQYPTGIPVQKKWSSVIVGKKRASSGIPSGYPPSYGGPGPGSGRRRSESDYLNHGSGRRRSEILYANDKEKQRGAHDEEEPRGAQV